MELSMSGDSARADFALAALARDCSSSVFFICRSLRLIVYSFNGAGVGGFPPRDLTLNWYRLLFADEAIWTFRAEQPAGRVGGHGDFA